MVHMSFMQLLKISYLLIIIESNARSMHMAFLGQIESEMMPFKSPVACNFRNSLETNSTLADSPVTVIETKTRFNSVPYVDDFNTVSTESIRRSEVDNKVLLSAIPRFLLITFYVTLCSLYTSTNSRRI